MALNIFIFFTFIHPSPIFYIILPLHIILSYSTLFFTNYLFFSITNIKNLKPTQIPDLDPMPIPDEEANIVDTNKPINPSTIPNKEEINQNTIDKLPNTGRSNFILIGILMILSGVAIVKNKK